MGISKDRISCLYKVLHFREWKLRDGKGEDFEEDEGEKRAREKGRSRERFSR